MLISNPLEKRFEKMHQKKVISKNVTEICTFFHFYSCSSNLFCFKLFCVHFLTTFSMDSKSAWNSAFLKFGGSMPLFLFIFSYFLTYIQSSNHIHTILRRGLMVRRGTVGSASACWKAGPSSILGSAPQGGLSHWAYKRWGNSAFLTPFLIFSKKIFLLGHISTFSNFEAKRAKNGSKNQKTYIVNVS